MRQPFRIAPSLTVASMQTYQIAAPASTHWRDATCAEFGCTNHHNGWHTTVDESTSLGQGQAFYIRHDRSRSCTEERLPGGLTCFTFPAGQKCFSQHRVRVPRPELYIVKGGDWRGNPTGQRRVHANAADWVDDFGEHQLAVIDGMKRG